MAICLWPIREFKMFLKAYGIAKDAFKLSLCVSILQSCSLCLANLISPFNSEYKFHTTKGILSDSPVSSKLSQAFDGEYLLVSVSH